MEGLQLKKAGWEICYRTDMTDTGWVLGLFPIVLKKVDKEKPRKTATKKEESGIP